MLTIHDSVPASGSLECRIAAAA
ncbi:hypothetical protein EMIT0111MI5_90091 [Burkholderia sp. IT-111MI5]